MAHRDDRPKRPDLSLNVAGGRQATDPHGTGPAWLAVLLEPNPIDLSAQRPEHGPCFREKQNLPDLPACPCLAQPAKSGHPADQIRSAYTIGILTPCGRS